MTHPNPGQAPLLLLLLHWLGKVGPNRASGPRTKDQRPKTVGLECQ